MDARHRPAGLHQLTRGPSPRAILAAEAGLLVGDVQGSPYRANLGNSKGALESYRKSLAIREKLASDAKENAQIKLDLLQSYGAVGELSQVTANLP